MYSYESDWRPYAFPRQKTRFASQKDLDSLYTPVILQKGLPLKAGGMPICSDGTNATINTMDQHTILFGGTASKKTRTLVAPLICNLAQAGESMVIMDVKGELSSGADFPQIRGILRDQGYHSIFFNLRTMDGDAYNPLLEPYHLLKRGDTDGAAHMVSDLIEALASVYHGTSADPFWEFTSKQILIAICLLLFRFADSEDSVNMLSLASYANTDGCTELLSVLRNLPDNSNIVTMARNVISESEKTLSSTMATANSFLTNFLTNEKLLRMMSCSTFDIHSFYREPTALFIILPDENTTFSGIASLMLQQLTTVLVSDAYALGGRLPRRVNLVCDEFCNYHMPSMAQAISAHRSRNIRWYLVCQSLRQLEHAYPKESDTILANCQNLYFLSSPELSLMQYLSDQAGTITISSSGAPVPLISVEDLQSLQKGRDYTSVYFTSGTVHYVTKLPDISCYSYLREYRELSPLTVHTYPAPPVFSPHQMLHRVRELILNSPRDLSEDFSLSLDEILGADLLSE